MLCKGEPGAGSLSDPLLIFMCNCGMPCLLSELLQWMAATALAGMQTSAPSAPAQSALSGWTPAPWSVHAPGWAAGQPAGHHPGAVGPLRPTACSGCRVCRCPPVQMRKVSKSGSSPRCCSTVGSVQSQAGVDVCGCHPVRRRRQWYNCCATSWVAGWVQQTKTCCQSFFSAA